MNQISLRSRFGPLSRWLKRHLPEPVRAQLRRLRGPRPAPMIDSAVGKDSAGGKLGNVADLLSPEFGAAFRARLPEKSQSPRKLWELAWLAQQFENLKLSGDFLGLGVGHEPLIFHLAHVAKSVVATDLFDIGTAWAEARLAVEAVYEASPFPYPRERLKVQNADMRRLEFPNESFDAVWSCSSVEHVQTLPQFVQIFREIHRVLRPGGVALITTEFSLGDPYFLPGVLSLWKDSALFGDQLRGLTLTGPIDRTYHGEFPGNHPLSRRDVHRVTLMHDFSGPIGVCTHVGYTRLIPVAMTFRKTGPTFDWPEHLGAPAWYVPFAAGVEAFWSKNPGQAGDLYRKALDLADTPGARLHCYRALVEAHVHAGRVEDLRDTLSACQGDLPGFPDDDDALDLIGYVAAGAGFLPFARRCFEKAHASPGALPSSRLRIRLNQLEAELKVGGPEARHLYRLTEAAWWEAVDFLGEGDILLETLRKRYEELRHRHQLTALRPSPAQPQTTPAPTATPSAAPVSIRNPLFDVCAPPARPLVYVGDHRALTRTVYGHKMYVDSRTHVGACFLLDGFWEEWVVRHLKDFVKPGMHAVDIGANMGFYTLLLADLVGPTGRVTAFEPQPEMLDILDSNIHLNGFQKRVTVVPKVVHQANGSYAFSSFERYGTGGCNENAEITNEGLKALGLLDKPVAKQFEGVSLDECFGSDPQIDFIKIDTDGSEPYVFRGMQSLLRSKRPLTMLCEYVPLAYADKGVDPLQFLEEIHAAGFAISEITPAGIEPVQSFAELTTQLWAELLLVRGAA